MDEFETEVLQKLDVIIQLLGTNMLKDFETNQEKIAFVYSLGYKIPREIHRITGIPMQTIYNTTSKLKKEDGVDE